jgi:pyruvate,water dikinase
MLLFTDRAMIYRQEKGFDHLRVALSIGVQKMVRADKAGSGVMFTIDTETGFGTWRSSTLPGVCENVQGTVNPDEYMVFKPLLANPGFTPIIEKPGGQGKEAGVRRGRHQDHQNLDTAGMSAIPSSHDNEILTLACWAGLSKSITASPWISNGPRTATPAGCSSSRPARKPSNPAGKPATSKPMR